MLWVTAIAGFSLQGTDVSHWGASVIEVSVYQLSGT